tara:strand:+ start:961 stop:1290 length:330 start_codon:yes stop_codon:yes gene_type:complete
LDHVTLNRWVEKYAGNISAETHHRTTPTGCSWRVDETYVKVKGQWTYLYRAITRKGILLILCCQSAGMKPLRFFVNANGNNGWPDKVVILQGRIKRGRFVQHELPTGDA